jgi:hypothetical protein
MQWRTIHAVFRMLRILIVALVAAVSANIVVAGEYRWPLCNGGEYAGFGYRVDPFTGRVAFHAGADMSGDYGDTVRAARAGRVVAAERRGPYGLMIEIDHGNGHGMRYAHFRCRWPTRRQGQKIGEVGATAGRQASICTSDLAQQRRRRSDPQPAAQPDMQPPRRQVNSAARAADPPPNKRRNESSLEALYATRFCLAALRQEGDNFGYRKDMDGRSRFVSGPTSASRFAGARCCAGRVLMAEERRLRQIEIDHGKGFRTRYANLDVPPDAWQIVGRGKSSALPAPRQNDRTAASFRDLAEQRRTSAAAY